MNDATCLTDKYTFDTSLSVSIYLCIFLKISVFYSEMMSVAQRENTKYFFHNKCSNRNLIVTDVSIVITNDKGFLGGLSLDWPYRILISGLFWSNVDRRDLKIYIP